jgi:hypothetical protein
MLHEKLKPISPRPLTARESGWARDILGVNPVWRDADTSRTQVVAEGLLDEGIAFVLEAIEPENPKAKGSRESVGQLWIQLIDGSTINVQLSQIDGRLKELYVLLIAPNNPNRQVPDDWIEVSREAVDL